MQRSREPTFPVNASSLYAECFLLFYELILTVQNISSKGPKAPYFNVNVRLESAASSVISVRQSFMTCSNKI